MKPVPKPNPRTGIACLQVQAPVIQKILSLRISGEQNLKATVQAIAVHPIRTHPPPDLLIPVEKKKGNAGILQGPGARQPRHPRPNNQNRLSIGHVHRVSLISEL